MSSSRHQQRGMVLVLGLIMLLVITVLGVSALTTSNLEQRMAANAQNSGVTFQAAESAILRTMADDAQLTAAVNGSGTVTTQYTDIAANVSTATELTSGSPTFQPGTSFKIGAYPFDIRGTASMNATGSASEHLQGIRRMAPLANNN